jgi:hypothetical protein
MENTTVAAITRTDEHVPERNIHLENALIAACRKIVSEIQDIDFSLLVCRKELIRAQRRLNGHLVLNFTRRQKTQNAFDVKPQMARMYQARNGSWVPRDLNFEPGTLHTYYPFGKTGLPDSQDRVVVGLLRQVDILFEQRARLMALTRPLRQTLDGSLERCRKIRRQVDMKVDVYSHKIGIDWNDALASNVLDATKEFEKRAKRTRKKKVDAANS